MECALYSMDGPLMGRGSCEERDGTIVMTVEEWHTTPQKGSQGHTIAIEGSGLITVRVDDVEVVTSDPARGHREIYRMTRVDDNAEQRGGPVEGVKHGHN